MIDYRKPTDQLVFDLIEESNPGFKTTFDITKLALGTPTAITVDQADPYKRDTKIRVSGKPGSDVIGIKDITYRRIDLLKLMNGMASLVCREYAVNSSLPPSQWRPFINKALGVNIPAASWSSSFNLGSTPSWVPGNAANYTVQLGTTDLCYINRVPITYIAGKRTVNDILGAEPVVNGRLWPGGNDFSAGSKPRGEFLAYGMDFSEINNLAMIAGPVTIAVGANNFVTDAILARLQAQSPEYNWANLIHTTPGGILGTVWTRVTLPNAAVPEANPAYKYCWYIPAPSTGSWWQGKLIFHFNDQVV